MPSMASYVMCTPTILWGYLFDYLSFILLLSFVSKSVNCDVLSSWMYLIYSGNKVEFVMFPGHFPVYINTSLNVHYSKSLI